MPSVGYCVEHLRLHLRGVFGAATFASQSAMYFFMKSMAFMSSVAPGPWWPGMTMEGFKAVI